MRSLFKQNLLKSNWIMLNPDEVRVIDSNRAIEEKMMMPATHQDDGDVSLYQPVSFDEEGSGDADGVDLLFSENPETAQAQQREQEQQALNAAQVQEAQAQAEEIIQQANARAQEIMEQARIMSEQDARAAYDKASAQGMQDGYQQGIQKANAEAEAIRSEYRRKEQELERSYEEKLDELEPHLVKELTAIYEHIFEVELSQYRNILKHLISNTLRSVEMSEHYLIHVSDQDYSYVSMQKAQIMEEGCVKNANLEIVEDRTLTKNECLVETEDGIFDCSLSVQLTELKRKLQLLSYTGNKE